MTFPPIAAGRAFARPGPRFGRSSWLPQRGSHRDVPQCQCDLRQPEDGDWGWPVPGPAATEWGWLVTGPGSTPWQTRRRRRYHRELSSESLQGALRQAAYDAKQGSHQKIPDSKSKPAAKERQPNGPCLCGIRSFRTLTPGQAPPLLRRSLRKGSGALLALPVVVPTFSAPVLGAARSPVKAELLVPAGPSSALLRRAHDPGPCLALRPCPYSALADREAPFRRSPRPARAFA
jgi:hypothetical protein